MYSQDIKRFIPSCVTDKQLFMRMFMLEELYSHKYWSLDLDLESRISLFQLESVFAGSTVDMPEWLKERFSKEDSPLVEVIVFGNELVLTLKEPNKLYPESTWDGKSWKTFIKNDPTIIETRVSNISDKGFVERELILSEDAYKKLETRGNIPRVK
jgi:hypothetical protein